MLEILYINWESLADGRQQATGDGRENFPTALISRPANDTCIGYYQQNIHNRFPLLIIVLHQSYKFPWNTSAHI